MGSSYPREARLSIVADAALTQSFAVWYTPASMNADSQPRATAVVEPLDLRLPLESAVVSFAHARDPAILESSLGHEAYGRYSIFACDPLDDFELGSRSRVCPFRALASRAATYPRTAEFPEGVPFAGGWIGFFTYEAGLTVERIPSRRLQPARSFARAEACGSGFAIPSAGFRLYDAAAIHDHRSGRWYLAAIDWPKPIAERRPPAAARLAALRSRLTSAAQLELTELDRPSAREPTPNMSREAYFAKVTRAKRYIEAGDIYQVNLTQRFTTRTDASPLDLYRRLRAASPSSHAALLPWGEAVILSSSPELFLQLRGGHVVTRPIKGTRPRVGDPGIDAANRRELAESEKDRAELTMIIDLLRNDLGRVCAAGSVRVTEAGSIEEHPTVFHRVATIEGDVEDGRTFVDLLRAASPGGSVTGAPKIRAMQIIEELEPTRRGVYCGSIGMIGLDGSMTLSVAIRTMVQVGPEVHVHAGGAIVADSTAEEEFDEILAKARGMLQALGCSATSRSRFGLAAEKVKTSKSRKVEAPVS